MRIFILTLGPRGEFELFLTLAHRLRQRGHQVMLGTASFFGDRVRQAGVEWTALGTATLEDQLAALRAVADIPDRLRRVKEYAQRWLYPQLALSAKHCEYLAQRADYFINKVGIGVKRPNGQLVPSALVTYDLPVLAESLPPVAEGESADPSVLNLVAMNKQLVDPEDKAGPRYQFSGFWRAERPPTVAVPAALEEFVRTGSRPVVLVMGSLVMFDARRLAEAFAAALRLTGQRGVIVTGWSGLMRKTAEAPPVVSADAAVPVESWSGSAPLPTADDPTSLMAGWSTIPPAAVAGPAPVVGAWGAPSGAFAGVDAPAPRRMDAPVSPLPDSLPTLEPTPILGRSTTTEPTSLPAPPAPILLDEAVLCVDEVPYDWLFAQAACVIHQGGLGTLIEVLRAGVPSIVLPQIPPQEYFGRMVDRNHLAVGSFDANTVDPPTLAGAIQRALADEEIGRSGRHWQEIVAAEQGLERALDLIEDHAKTLPEKTQQAPRTFRRRRDPGGW